MNSGMRHDGLERGFTIIEVAIFLGITGLMLTIAFAGTQAMVNNTRFNDSTRSLESYVQNQFEEVRNGVNSRLGTESCNGITGAVSAGGSPTDPGANNNCLLLGKAMYFSLDASNNTVVSTYTITGINTETTGNNLIDTIDSMPNLSPVGIETLDIPWEASFIGSESSTGVVPNMIAIIRSPSSSYIGVYNINAGPVVPSSATLLTSPMLTAGADSLATYCIQSTDFPPKKAALAVERGTGSAIVNMDYQPTDEECGA